MAFLTIKKPGPLTLLQDKGRSHQQHLGLSQGGAADQHAFFWANYLLANNANTAALEITFGPFEAVFSDDTHIAICGANLNCKLNGEAISTWQSHKIKAGDTIYFSGGNNGIRCYLAVQGGFQGEKHFSSWSEVPREKLNPQTVTRGAEIGYQTTSNQFPIRLTPERFIPNYQDVLCLRILPSYQYKRFPERSKITLLNNEYEVSRNSDRMGYRLNGKALEWNGDSILSEGIALGSIQIPPDGQPIVLLNDRQTIGGYPKIGTVCLKDCSQLAQRQANQKVYFELVNLDSLTPVQGRFNWLHPQYY